MTALPPGGAEGAAAAGPESGSATGTSSEVADAPSPADVSTPPGAGRFTLEGRAAPGLYFVGWIASVVGLVTLFVALQAGGGGGAILLTLIGAAILSIGLVAAAGSQAIERRRRGGAYRGPSPFLVFAASLPLTVLLVIVVIAPVSLLGLDASSPLATLISVTLTAVIYFVLVRLLVVDQGALSWAEMGWRRPDAAVLRELASGAVLAFPVTVVVMVLAAVLVELVGAAPGSIVLPSPTPVGVLVNLVSAIVVAPTSEELFFRGFATTAWARGIGARGGLLRGALFFAFIHVLFMGGTGFGDAAGRALVAFVARIPVALALGWVFLSRRSIYPSIGLHAAYNGILVVLAQLAVTAGG